jgi:hypothetical protein
LALGAALAMPTNDDDTLQRGHGAVAHRMSVAVRCLFFGIALTGCGLNSDPGSVLVDSGTYLPYHCSDLIDQWGKLLKREQELRQLMGRASQGGGGTVIGALSYGTEYQTVETQKKLLQREAAVKNCELVHDFQSDQTIR